MSVENQPKRVSDQKFACHLLISYLNTLRNLGNSRSDGHLRLNPLFNPVLDEIDKLGQQVVQVMLEPSGDHQEVREALLSVMPANLIKLPTEMALKRVARRVDRYIKGNSRIVR